MCTACSMHPPVLRCDHQCVDRGCGDRYLRRSEVVAGGEVGKAAVDADVARGASVAGIESRDAMAAARAQWGWVLAVVVALAGCSEPDAPWEQAPPQSAVARSLHPRATVAGARINPDTTAGLLFFLWALPCGLVAGWSLFWWLHHRKRAAAERDFDPKAPLANGHRIVMGQVELEDGAKGAAIALAIYQRGHEWKSKHGRRHTWTEESRALQARTFWLRLADGSRVRVEPGDRVALRDDLSRIERTSHTERIRYAELEPGETAHVSGVLFGVVPAMGSAYRAAAVEPVLRPPRGERMVVSTERPGDVSDGRAGVYRAWLVGALALAVVLAATVFPSVALLELTGEAALATPVATRHWQVYRKPKNRPGYYAQHYGLRSERVVDGRRQVLTDECSEALWGCVRSGQCPQVRYTVSSLSDDVVQVGDGAQLTDGRAGLLALVSFALLLLFPLSATASRPWYLTRKLTDSASGRLPDFVASIATLKFHRVSSGHEGSP